MPLRDEIFLLNRDCSVLPWQERERATRAKLDISRKKKKTERELKWIFFFKLGAGVGQGHFKQNLGGAVYGQ